MRDGPVGIHIRRPRPPLRPRGPIPLDARPPTAVPAPREPWSALDARAVLGVGALVLAAGLLQTGLEQLMDARAGAVLLRWKVFPAVLWAAAAPLAVAAGARWPLAGGPSAGPRARGLRVAAWLAAFAAFHGAVNAVIRLPDLPRRGGAWLLDDGLSAWVEHAPAALPLFLLLVLAGGRLRSAAETRRPSGAPPPPPSTLALPGPNRIHRIPPAAIRWIEADGDYVRIHAEGRSVRARGTLKELEAALATSGRFVRVHRSSLVHADRVRELQPLGHGDWVAVLDDGTEIRVPRTRRRALDRLRGREEAEAGPG